MKKLMFALVLIILFISPVLSLAQGMEKPAQCIEGQKYWYGGSKLCTCVNSQITDSNCVYCQYGVTTDSNGTYICAESPNPCTNNPNTPGCQSQFTGGSTVLLFFIILIIFIVIFYYIYRKYKKVKRSKK
jgi:hypothetical protein